MWAGLKLVLGAIVNSLASSLFSALRRKRRDEELKEAARNEVHLKYEREAKEMLERWRKQPNAHRDGVADKLRKGKF